VGLIYLNDDRPHSPQRGVETTSAKSKINPVASVLADASPSKGGGL